MRVEYGYVCVCVCVCVCRGWFMDTYTCVWAAYALSTHLAGEKIAYIRRKKKRKKKHGFLFISIHL